MRKHGILFSVISAALAVMMCGCAGVDGADNVDSMDGASNSNSQPANSGGLVWQTSGTSSAPVTSDTSGGENPEFPSKCGIFKQTAKVFTEEQLLSFFSEKPERTYREVTETAIFEAETERGSTSGIDLNFYTDAGVLCRMAYGETYGEGIYTNDEELEFVPRDKMLEDINKLIGEFGFSREEWFISKCYSVKAELLDEFKDRTYKALTEELEENPYSLDENEIQEQINQAERINSRPSKDFYYIDIRFKIDGIPIFPESILETGVWNAIHPASCKICYSKDGIESISIGYIPITGSSEEVEIMKYDEARQLISKKYNDIIFNGKVEVSEMKLVYIAIPQNEPGIYNESFETRPYWAFRCTLTEERDGKPHTTNCITYFDAVTGAELGTEQLAGANGFIGG